MDFNLLKKMKYLRYLTGTQTGNIGLITVLSPADGANVRPIIVGNVHLTWKPTRNDLRTFQVRYSCQCMLFSHVNVVINEGTHDGDSHYEPEEGTPS